MAAVVHTRSKRPELVIEAVRMAAGQCHQAAFVVRTTVEHAVNMVNGYKLIPLIYFAHDPTV